jgi:hypothetical protein
VRFELPSTTSPARTLFLEWAATVGSSAPPFLQQHVQSLLPHSLELDTPWPNPAAGPVAIEYALPASADVRLELFDLFGRRVAVLSDGIQAAGRHRAAWSAARPGVYVCRLSAGGATLRRKIVVAP